MNNHIILILFIIFTVSCKMTEPSRERTTAKSVGILADSSANLMIESPQEPIEDEEPEVEETPEEPEPPKDEHETEKVLETVMDFESFPLGKYTPFSQFWLYSWGGVNGEQWRDYSTFDVIESGGSKVLKMWVSNEIRDGSGSFNYPYSKANINSILRGFSIVRYLQPEVDALRVKIKWVQGSVGITFGAPVSQVGTSDVLTKVKYFSENSKSDCLPLGNQWYECDFNFNEDLIRNTRRGNFTLDSNGKTLKNSKGEEIISFTRWVQEPLSLYMVSYDSNDVKILSGNPILYFDDFQFVHKGKGRKFVDGSNSIFVKEIEGFETNIKNSFTVDFGFPINQAAPSLSHVDGGLTGKKSLQIVSKTAEESSWTGFSAHDAAGANAVSFDMKITYAANDKDPNHVIDFIALSNEKGNAFNWNTLADTLRGYTYILSRLLISHPAYLNPSPPLDPEIYSPAFAIYHARRIIPRDQWVKVTIPFADFSAVYGNYKTSFEQHASEQKPLLASEISVVGLQTTFMHGRANTTILIDQIRYEFLNGSDESLRSFWQGQAFQE